MKDGFYRIAAATPPVAVANVEENQAQILEKIQQAASQGCGAVCFPELSLTAYTCGDLFKDRTLLAGAESALASLLEDTAGLDILCAVGVPVPWQGALYNCAAVFHKGRLLGLSAKTYIPNYSEFYEAPAFHRRPAAHGGHLCRAEDLAGPGAFVLLRKCPGPAGGRGDLRGPLEPLASQCQPGFKRGHGDPEPLLQR